MRTHQEDQLRKSPLGPLSEEGEGARTREDELTPFGLGRRLTARPQILDLSHLRGVGKESLGSAADCTVTSSNQECNAELTCNGSVIS